MSAIKSLAKETLIYGLSYSLGRVINFLLVTFYLTTYVFTGKDGSLSIYQDIYFYIGLLLGVLTLRMETTLFRYLKKDNDNKGLYALLSQMVMMACVIFFIIIIALKTPLLQFLNYPESFSKSVLVASIILILDVISSLPFAKLRYDKKSIRYAWIKLAGIGLNIFLVLYIFEIHYAQEEINQLTSSQKIFLVLIANAVSSLVTLIMLRNEVKLSFVKADWKMSLQILKYSWPLILVTLVYTVIQNGYTSFLKYLLPGSRIQNLSASDDLVAAVRLAVIMNIFITAFNYAAEPFFFRHAGMKDSKQIYAQLNLFFVICCCAIYFLTCLNVNLVSMLIGPAYRSAIHLLPIFLLANIFAGIFTNMSSWYKLNDKTVQAAWISIGGFILNALLFILLVPKYGRDVTAWISLAVYVFMAIVSYVQGQRNFYIPYDLIRTSFYLGGTISMVYVVSTYFKTWYADAILMFAFSILLFIGYCYFVYRFEYCRILSNTLDNSET